MSRPLLAALATVALTLAACGDDDADVAVEEEPAAEDTGSATTAADPGADTDTGSGGDLYGAPGGDGSTAGDGTGGAAVTTATTELGEVLVDAEGHTLYGFTNDAEGAPTCTDGCAQNWPPLFVDAGEVPEDLDPAVFSVVEHPSGEFQLVAGDWPLYRYAADSGPGETTGQGVGGVWFVVDPAGELIRE